METVLPAELVLLEPMLAFQVLSSNPEHFFRLLCTVDSAFVVFSTTLFQPCSLQVRLRACCVAQEHTMALRVVARVRDHGCVRTPSA